LLGRAAGHFGAQARLVKPPARELQEGVIAVNAFFKEPERGGVNGGGGRGEAPGAGRVEFSIRETHLYQFSGACGDRTHTTDGTDGDGRKIELHTGVKSGIGFQKLTREKIPKGFSREERGTMEFPRI
jgi:hypothetical protein